MLAQQCISCKFLYWSAEYKKIFAQREYDSSMSQKHSYFRFTTAQQRKLLFEIWETTGSVTEACQKAHVGRATFYYWKPRFTDMPLQKEKGLKRVYQ